MSGGSFAAAGLAVQGYPTLDTLIASGNLNNTANQTAFAELAYKAELGFPITYATYNSCRGRSERRASMD